MENQVVNAESIYPGLWQDNRKNMYMWLINGHERDDDNDPSYSVCFGGNTKDEANENEQYQFVNYSRKEFLQVNKEYIFIRKA
jgi:hypothetical protein